MPYFNGHDVFMWRYLVKLSRRLANLSYCITNDNKNYNFLDCDGFKRLVFCTNSLAKLLPNDLLSDSTEDFKGKGVKLARLHNEWGMPAN